MIVKCNNNKIQEIVDYIGKEYGKCLYLYIDLIKYGCNSEFTNVWKDVDGNRIRMVMLAYHSALHLYSQNLDFNVDEIVRFIRDMNPSIICASKPLIERIESSLSNDGYISEFGHIGKRTSSPQMKEKHQVELAKEEDVDQIARLLYEDDDIGASYTYDDLVAQINERLSQGFVRSFVIRQDNKIVAHLGTGAEIQNLCTINYVITDLDYRGKGLSSSLFSYACQQLESEGKEIFSVYYPENSRRLHHKMGFEDFCEFGKLYKNIV